MIKSSVSLAVAGVLAAASASAANYDIWVTGASAQRAFWAADMAANICGGANNMTTYSMGGPTNKPDNAAYRCTVSASPAISGVTNGTDVLTMHYSAELGSIGGISQFLPGRPSTRLYVNPNGTDCSAPAGLPPTSTCTIISYDGDNDAFTSTNSDALVAHAGDVGVTDVEPKHWLNSVNWPDNAWTNPGGVHGKVTPTDLSALTGGGPENGQAFSVIVNNAGPLAGVGSISRASFAAILAGKYSTWGQVPEVAGLNANQISLCRRDTGSGTEVAASIFTTGFECGRSTTNVASIASPGSLNPAKITENPSTTALKACVVADTNAIGFANVSPSGTYTTLKIDGVEANAHNAAAGIYAWGVESYISTNKSATTQGAPVSTIVGQLISRAKAAATLPAAEGGAFAGGQWVATTAKANYALPGGGFGNNAFQSANAWKTNTTTAVTAMVYKSGDNCKTSFNNNAQ